MNGKTEKNTRKRQVKDEPFIQKPYGSERNFTKKTHT